MEPRWVTMTDVQCPKCGEDVKCLTDSVTPGILYESDPTACTSCEYKGEAGQLCDLVEGEDETFNHNNKRCQSQ